MDLDIIDGSIIHNLTAFGILEWSIFAIHEQPPLQGVTDEKQ